MKKYPKSRMYLGDNVYAEIDGFGDLVLSTDDEFQMTNRIVLDDMILENLLQYLEIEIIDGTK